MVCKFKLNGQEHKLEFEIDRYLSMKDPRLLVQKVHGKIVEEIAKVLTLALFEGPTTRDLLPSHCL